MALAFETVYGTAPTSGYRLVPSAGTMLSAQVVVFMYEKARIPLEYPPNYPPFAR
jgi:hypothetical protein